MATTTQKTNSPVGGAITASGQIVGAGGAVLGTASSADRYGGGGSSSSRRSTTPTATATPATPTPVTPSVTPDTQIDIGQPSPKTADATPFTDPKMVADLNAARATAVESGQSAYGGSLSSLSDYAKTYRQASELGKSVTNAPQTGGTAAPQVRSLITQAQAGQTRPTAILGDMMQTDGNFDKIFTQFDDFFSPPQQKTSLVEEYKALSDTLGISKINEELINDKKIIDGTEEDIRKEVQAANGFATDSQVQAMANARNKSLIKNYNALLATRDSAMTQLSTMMNLTIEDRKAAQSEFDRKMDYAFKVADFKTKAIQNARETYNNIVKVAGYQGLVSSAQGDPGTLSRMAQVLGMTPDGLNKLASQPNLDQQKQRLEIEKLQADIAKTKSETISLSSSNPQNIAYAQEYAATGKIPTGLPKGSFGEVAQIAKELPKAKGQIVSTSTNVSPTGNETLQTAIGSLYSAVELAKQLKELDTQRYGGIVAGTLGKVFGSDSQQRYIDLKDQISDLLARARSGAALNAAEEKRYGNMLPGRFSEPLGLGAGTQTKIDNFVNALSSDIKNKASTQGWAIHGFSTVKIGDTDYTVGDVVKNSKGQQGRVNPDGTITLI